MYSVICNLSIGYLILATIFGLGGKTIGEVVVIKDKWEKINRLSIRVKVDVYEVCAYSILYIVIRFIMTILTLNCFRHICGISHNRVNSFMKCWLSLFYLIEDK